MGEWGCRGAVVVISQAWTKEKCPCKETHGDGPSETVPFALLLQEPAANPRATKKQGKKKGKGVLWHPLSRRTKKPHPFKERVRERKRKRGKRQWETTEKIREERDGKRMGEVQEVMVKMFTGHHKAYPGTCASE